MGNHTIFLVDIGDTDSRLAPCCGQAACHRGRRQRLSRVELEERSRTKAELQDSTKKHSSALKVQPHTSTIRHMSNAQPLWLRGQTDSSCSVQRWKEENARQLAVLPFYESKNVQPGREH
jgi:hypothetical protein